MTRSWKNVDKSVRSGIIKSLDIDDFKMFAKGDNIDGEVTDIITGVVKEFEDKGNVFISDVHFGSFFDFETKKHALMQVYNNHFGIAQIKNIKIRALKA